MKVVKIFAFLAVLLFFSVSSVSAFSNRLCTPLNPACSGGPIHEDITAEGLNFLKADVIEEISDEHSWVDVTHLEDSEWHFDDCEFRESTENINLLYNELLGYLNPNAFESEDAQETFGKILHPVQDFYSHSNWVESAPLGSLIDNGNGLWTILDPYDLHKEMVVIQGETIPTGVTLERNGSIVTVVASQSNSVNLPEGSYLGLISGSSYIADDCPDSIVMSHDDLNKDKPGTDGSLPLHPIARQNAVMQTTHEWCRLVNLVDERYNSDGVNKLIEEWVGTNLSEEDAVAASCGHVDTVLIIDSSGSMSSNDPQRRRIDSAKAFIDSAQEGDSIAVVRFSSNASVVYGLRTILSPEDREALKAAVDTIGQSGSTNINAALNTGFNQLQYGSASNRKVAVLLTDGDHNVGDYDPQSHLQFADKGWTLHTIGLGVGGGNQPVDNALLEPEADTNVINAISSDFLTDIAAATGGSYYSADNANELIQVFKNISSRTLRAEELENSDITLLEGNPHQLNVALPDGNRSATFFTNWNNGDVSMSLTSPSGQSISETTVNANIYHAKSGIYELYTIQNPEDGAWVVTIDGTSLAAEGELVNAQVTAVNEIATGNHVYLPMIVSASDGTPPPPPPPSSEQRFTIAVGDVVGIGAPAAGAGHIESAGAKDIYTFTAVPGQAVYFDERGASDDLRWQVEDETGAVIMTEETFSTTDPGLFVLQQGGKYTITVRGDNDTVTGTYQFKLLPMPAPQTFSMNTDQLIPNELPAIGAGRIESVGSKDVYTFSATPGQVVYFDEVSTNANFLWEVRDQNGAVVVSEQTLSTSDPGFKTLTLGGIYTITVRGLNDVSTGNYQFQVLSIPTPQQFSINIDDVVSDGVPDVGAGNIETIGAKDIYTFTAVPGQVVYFDEQGATGSLRWSVQDANGTTIVSEQTLSTSDAGLRTLALGGSYTITVHGSGDTSTGTYQFQLLSVPAPQQFAINIDDVISDGVPAVGAGNIEALGSRDIYTFTAVPGQTVYFDEQGASGAIRWSVQDANGTVIFSDQTLSTGDAGLKTLALGGTYTIIVRGSNDTGTGTYQFQVLSLPTPQQFAINIDDVVSDGVPAAGAGNIEAIGSEDIYTFTAAPGQTVYFDEQGATGSLRWSVQDANGGYVFYEQTLSTGDAGLKTLTLGGTYTIRVKGSNGNGIGTYQFQILSLPAPQQFAINIGDVVSDGVPAAGAGNIEAIGSEDIYTFTATPGQSVYFDEQGAVGNIRWSVQDANGSYVFYEQALSTGDAGLKTLTLGGTYTITVRGSGGTGIGTYQFQITNP